MKKHFFVFLSLFLILFIGCSENSTVGPDSDSPSLTLSDISLDFGEYDNEHMFSLHNSGFGQVEWYADENCDWLELIPESGVVEEEWDYVHARLNRENMPVGDYNTEILITGSNGQQKTISVSMIVLPPQPEYFWRVHNQKVNLYSNPEDPGYLYMRDPVEYQIPMHGHVEVSIDCRTSGCAAENNQELELIILTSSQYKAFMKNTHREKFASAPHITIPQAGVYTLSTDKVEMGDKIIVVVDYSRRGWEYQDWEEFYHINDIYYDLEAVFIPEGWSEP